MTTNLVKLLDRLEKLESKSVRLPYEHKYPSLISPDGNFASLSCSEITAEYIVISANILPTLLAVIRLQAEALKKLKYIDEVWAMSDKQVSDIAKETELKLEKLLEGAE